MSAIPFTTRPATDADGPFVYDLKRQALGTYIEATWGWDENVQRELHRHRFRPLEMEILLVASEPVGCCLIRRKPDEIVLVAIYVLPDWQSKGIGSSILEMLVEEARARHVPIRLSVLRVNERAVALYARHGFEVCETTDTHHVMRRG